MTRSLFTALAFGLSICMILMISNVVAFPALAPRSISHSLYDDLRFYWQYTTSTNNPTCARPNGNHLVYQINNFASGNHGFIVRDDKRKEFVVTFQGTANIPDLLDNGDTFMAAYQIYKGHAPAGVQAHHGYQEDFNSVAASIYKQLSLATNKTTYDEYRFVLVGHSLGGAVASVGITGIANIFPNRKYALYTYGQPRVYNKAGAEWMQSKFGNNIFRSTHTDDAVPRQPPKAFGFIHFAPEYYQSPDPPSAGTTRRCNGMEDPTCIAKYGPGFGLNAAHLVYYGINIFQFFCT